MNEYFFFFFFSYKLKKKILLNYKIRKLNLSKNNCFFIDDTINIHYLLKIIFLPQKTNKTFLKLKFSLF